MDCKALEYNDLSAQDTEWTNLIVAGGVRIPAAFDEIFFRSVTFRDIEKKKSSNWRETRWFVANLEKYRLYCCTVSYSLNEKVLRLYKG